MMRAPNRPPLSAAKRLVGDGRTAFGDCMDIQQILVLRGPNVWANFPVLEVWVRLSKELDVPSNTFPGFNERLMGWLPSMIEHRCGIGERGGFFQRLRTGTYLGHILEHTSLEIQSLVGPTVGFGRARESIIPSLYRVAIEYADERLGRACVETAIALLNAARENTPFSIDSELARLRAYAEQVCLGPSTQAIVTAARARGIPSIRLNDGNLVQLGYASAQHRIWTAESERTAAVAESIAQDKQLTRSLLKSVGVPVPEGRVVNTADDAWEAATDLGLPVVVKPREGNYGRGVSINLSTRESVLKAFELANAERDGVLVEQCIHGLHHRVLVVGNRVVAVAKGEPDQVVGDGVHTVSELVDLANAKPERGDPQTHQLSRLELDPIALELLAQHGYSPTSVPPASATVVLHYNGDPTIDVTPQLHPSTAKAAILAAQTVGLNIAGIDIVAEDIARPLEEQRGGILEVNASPGLLMHLRPLKGQAQPVGAAIVDEIFGANQTGRVPIVAVSGTNGKSSVIALLDAALSAKGRRLGVACSDGLFVEGRALGAPDGTSFESVESLLMNPAVDTILAEMNPRTVLTQGIAFDQCEVAVVTNFGSSDHLGYTAMDRDRMALVERCGVDMVLPSGTAVLNADDATVLEMAAKCKGKVLLFGQDHAASALVAHRAQGERTLSLREDRIVFSVGEKLAHEAPCPCQVSRNDLENLLASVGALWALNVEPSECVELVRRELFRSRGSRVQWADLDGKLVAVGVCRNPSAIEALVQSAAGISGRRIALWSHVPADWSIEHAQAVGRLLGASFDRVELAHAAGNNGGSDTAGTLKTADAPSAEHAGAVRLALSDSVREGQKAALKETSGPVSERFQRSVAELERGDLIFVQVSDLEGISEISKSWEGLRKQCGSSTVTDAAQLTRPLAET
jgi:cyanophycin synthetase